MPKSDSFTSAFLESRGQYVASNTSAMPLKYALGRPEAVTVLGRIHGLLFVRFIAALGRLAVDGTWNLVKLARAFLSSLVPFGAFWHEWTLRKEDQGKANAAATQG